MVQGLTNLELQSGEGERILLCLPAGIHLEAIKERLLKGGCKVFLASSPHDALKRLQIDSPRAVIIEESWVAYFENLSMDSRRELICVLIGKGLTTGDYIAAYIRSVDLVVDTEDISSLYRLLNETIESHERLYRTFKNMLREVKRIERRIYASFQEV